MKSYGRKFSFTLRFMNQQSSLTKPELIIENSELRLRVSRRLDEKAKKNTGANNNNNNNNNDQVYDDEAMISTEFEFKLIDTESWSPPLSANQFQRLLSNITFIRIRAVPSSTHTYLERARLESAQPVASSGVAADLDVVLSLSVSTYASWVETCKCPPGYAGQFCEECAHDFRRDSLRRCVPCTCNNHSVGCDAETGACACTQHTTGEQCEQCESGYYGNALLGTPSDCQKCPCPYDGPCALVSTADESNQQQQLVCLKCPKGTRGNLCDECDDGYYETGAPTPLDPVLKCSPCACNGNIDDNAVGNCDRKTGECLRCVFNTTGVECERCLSTYWGEATSERKCHACDCSPHGSENAECELSSGQCTCRANVVGRQCDRCRATYWNLVSGAGCEKCRCNPLGSLDLTCDEQTGVCRCRPGVVGAKCDQCAPNHYGFGTDGCTPCQCHPEGAVDQQCDIYGRCKCRGEHVAGYKCDHCAENYHSFAQHGCVRCDDCYTLVQTNLDGLRTRVDAVALHLKSIDLNETSVVSAVDDEDNRKLLAAASQAQAAISSLSTQVFNNKGKHNTTHIDSYQKIENF